MPPDEPMRNWLLPTIAKAERLSGLLIERPLAALDITYSEFRLMGQLLGEPGGLTQKELAARMGLDPSSVSVALAPLERRGLVERTRDPKDRRNVIVRLATSAPQLARVFAIVGAVDEVVASQIGKEDHATLRTLLGRAVAVLEREAVAAEANNDFRSTAKE